MPQATRQFSIAFSSGIERVMRDASAPSGMTHLALVLTPASSQQGLQRNAGMIDIVDHAMGELAAIELGSAPFHAGIGGAF